MRSLGCQPGLLKCKGGFLMAERQNKVKKYRKPLNLNIGMLIFGASFNTVFFKEYFKKILIKETRKHGCNG